MESRSEGRSAWKNSQGRERYTIAPKILDTTFVGSFFALDQMPRDRLPQVAVAGRSNVGKSSLLNQVVGRKKLAKVSSTPGRTRSVNFFRVNERFYLVDLPGYGYAKVSKGMREEWRELIEDYLTGVENLVGLVLLMDCRRDPTDEDWQLIEWLADRQLPVLVALTKSDKLNRDKLNRKVKQVESELGVAVIPFSIVNGMGKRELTGSILELVD
jgi:GTP-binding protein